MDSLDYLSFLQLESNAGLVFTDSGGVQGEICVLGTPCVTLDVILSDLKPLKLDQTFWQGEAWLSVNYWRSRLYCKSFIGFAHVQMV